MIRIPAAAIDQLANALTLRLSALLLAGFILLYLLTYALNQRLIYAPLGVIRRKAGNCRWRRPARRADRTVRRAGVV